MKNYLRKTSLHLSKLFVGLLLGVSLFTSCKDDYFYDDLMPSWLGSSIYDYLEEKGTYKYTVKLIDDLDYAEVLKKTGSKTLFVAKDSAYDEFFKNNEWGVKSYEQLSLAQKKMLFHFSMINNAYLIETLSNYFGSGNLNEGSAMRRETSLSALDSIPHLVGDQLPTSSYWNYHREKGVRLLSDATAKPMVYFLQPFLDKNSITNDDVSILTGGLLRSTNNVHVFNNKVVEKDITCKNGYVNVLESVLLPPKNMAQYITDNSNTKIFSKLLDRFCAPYFDPTNTSLYHELHPEFNDSIFVKKYFASLGGRTALPSGINAPNLLTYDPGWNMYRISSPQSDMAAMFVPNDSAMIGYFDSGVGKILKDRFGSWDNVPDEIIVPFLKRHMRTSLIESVPSKFDKMVDTENYRLPVTKNQLADTYAGVNGEVYVTKAVYPPVDYISVYSPVLLSDNSKIMNWAINITETSVDGTKFAFYKLYLNSLVSRYSLFIPTDEYFNKYIDPIAYGQDVQGILKYWYNTKTSAVNATVYKYNKNTDVIGDSVALITDAAFLKNRLWDLLDSHIVVGDVESGQKYYVTKGNDLIHVAGAGSTLSVRGGGDIVNNAKSTTSKVFNQENGNTYFIDKPIQSALNSVYKTLSTTPQFSKFFSLLNGVPDTCKSQIFVQQGVDYKINFFNAYRYTIYVPTNEAIQVALENGTITSWEKIYSLPAGPVQYAAIKKMMKFLRYHFQDDAVFLGQSVNNLYQSATIREKNDLFTPYWGTAVNKYLKLGVVGSGNSLKIITEKNNTANVYTLDGLYNIIVKDYTFAKTPMNYKNVDGTGTATGAGFSTSTISTSASAVIHQIDNVLTFE